MLNDNGLHPLFIKQANHYKSTGWQCVGFAGAVWFWRKDGIVASCDMRTGERRRWVEKPIQGLATNRSNQ